MIIKTYRVSLKAKVTGPDFGPVIHLTEWIQDGSTCWSGAQNRVILNGWQIRAFLERCKQTSQGNHHTGGLDTTGRPDVPTEANPIPVLVLLNEFLIGSHWVPGNQNNISYKTGWTAVKITIIKDTVWNLLVGKQEDFNLLSPIKITLILFQMNYKYWIYERVNFRYISTSNKISATCMFCCNVKRTNLSTVEMPRTFTRKLTSLGNPFPVLDKSYRERRMCQGIAGGLI